MRALALAAAWPVLVACSGASADPSTPAPTPERANAVQLAPTPRGNGPHDVPQGSFTGAGDGCSNLLVYRGSEDQTQFAVVHIDKELLGLEVGSAKTIDLGMTPEGVEVFVDVYASAIQGANAYCTGHPGEEPAMTRWMAQAGELTIELTADPSSTDAAHPTYRATLHLDKVHLVGPEGGFAVVVPSVVIEDVRVGWSPR